ncbi:hypothetical protein [Neorhodopirellula pilleata]|uniref:Thioredoxin domain-containing protein n=1 Tax=Neorhodopirellula pilleata TaxID=2714738 RepID=A0A5C5ZXW5_9BACT|nr:hypothetical protein [Neorhodopirellula pilleata]TWT91851.1 hypothetical protein Pla100_48890 [Neorhodopirellula pilleata]
MFEKRNRLVESSRLGALSFVLLIFLSAIAGAEDPVFSGPQIGEKLSSFKILLVSEDAQATTVDPIESASEKPTVLIFVHQLTRPGMALTRAISEYVASQKTHNVQCTIVWLDDDQAAAEAYLRRAAPSLRFVVPVGVSIDGEEGPGAYGLNRNVELTILVANQNQVTANFALIQPSLTQAAQIASPIAALIDQPAPDQKQLEALAYPRGQAMRRGGETRRAALQNETSPDDRSTKTKTPE